MFKVYLGARSLITGNATSIDFFYNPVATPTVGEVFGTYINVTFVVRMHTALQTIALLTLSVARITTEIRHTK